MLIRCSKESQHPAVDPKTSGWASKRTRKTQRDGHKELRSKYWSYVRSPVPSHMLTFEQPFRTLAIKWDVNIFQKKSSCVFLPASLSCVVYSCVCLWCCVVTIAVSNQPNYTQDLPTYEYSQQVNNSSQSDSQENQQTHIFLSTSYVAERTK